MKRISLLLIVIFLGACNNTEANPSVNKDARFYDQPVKITSATPWTKDHLCTFYLQKRKDKDFKQLNSLPPCSRNIKEWTEPSQNLFDEEWEYQRIGNLPFELPLPIDHQQGSGSQFPTWDVYSLSDEQYKINPDDFFGLFFDQPCDTYPLCHVYLIDAPTKGKVVNEFIDPKRGILVRHFIGTGRSSKSQKELYHSFSITYMGTHYMIQYYPDHQHQNVDLAWNVLLHIKTDAMRKLDTQQLFLVEHTLPQPRKQNNSAQDELPLSK